MRNAIIPGRFLYALMNWFIQDTRRKCTEIPSLGFFAVPRLLLHQRRIGPWVSSVPPGCTPSLPRETDRTSRGLPPTTAHPSSSSSRRACGRRACTSARRPSWRASDPPSPRTRGGRSRATCKPSEKRVSVVGESYSRTFFGRSLPLLCGHLPFTGKISH